MPSGGSRPGLCRPAGRPLPAVPPPAPQHARPPRGRPREGAAPNAHAWNTRVPIPAPGCPCRGAFRKDELDVVGPRAAVDEPWKCNCPLEAPGCCCAPAASAALRTGSISELCCDRVRVDDATLPAAGARAEPGLVPRACAKAPALTAPTAGQVWLAVSTSFGCVGKWYDEHELDPRATSGCRASGARGLAAAVGLDCASCGGCGDCGGCGGCGGCASCVRCALCNVRCTALTRPSRLSLRPSESAGSSPSPGGVSVVTAAASAGGAEGTGVLPCEGVTGRTALASLPRPAERRGRDEATLLSDGVQLDGRPWTAGGDAACRAATPGRTAEGDEGEMPCSAPGSRTPSTRARRTCFSIASISDSPALLLMRSSTTPLSTSTLFLACSSRAARRGWSCADSRVPRRAASSAPVRRNSPARRASSTPTRASRAATRTATSPMISPRSSAVRERTCTASAPRSSASPLGRRARLRSEASAW
mmetsp:Transcript_140560/g.437120  ORF Transcript_140560/g.437120 Transcript_140560/m.437120 type:complete len:478 (+) Transcript_140560:36-1469(+)